MNVFLRVDERAIGRFTPLFGGGFQLVIETGLTIRDLLCNAIGVEEAYLDQRIQTVFLNGRAVDDVNTAIVNDDSVLSLSAAMPGLVGATFRRGGHLAAFREVISHVNVNVPDRHSKGTLTIKLFNMVARELGPLFLKRGIQIPGDAFRRFLIRQTEVFWNGCRSLELDGDPSPVSALKAVAWGEDAVVLMVHQE